MLEYRKKNEFYIDGDFGEIPKGWTLKRFIKCFDFYPTASYSRENLSDVGDCSYIHYGDIHTKFDGFIDFKKEKLPYVEKKMASRYMKLKEGDLIIADASEDYDGVGKAVEVLNIGDVVAIAGLHTLHLRAIDDCLVNGFKAYVLNNGLVKNKILRSATGIKVYSISKSSLKNILIPVPPPDEQRTIASILSKVDEAIAATKNSIAKAERLKKALMQNLLTGKLKPDGSWRKEDEFYKDEKFGNIPVGWVYEKLGKLVLKITDGEHISPDMQDKGEYIVSAEDVFDDGVHFEKAKYVSTKDCLKFRKRCDPEFGDVLIVSRGASVGRTCKVQTTKLFCMMGSVILIKPQQNVLTNDFISIYLKTYEAWKELRRISGSSAQQAIYLAHLKKMRIMYPTDVTEQENITKSFEGVYKTIVQKEEKLKKIERLKKALMQNLLTGKVRIKVLKEQLQTETK